MLNQINIYVILHCEGEYEDYQETPIRAYLDEKLAKRYVTRWNKKETKRIKHTKRYGTFVEAKYVTIKLHNSIFC